MPDQNPTKLLAVRIASAFAAVGGDCIPAIQEYLLEADVPRQVSYGCRVDFWLDKDENLRARLVPTPPKLPTVQLEKTDFTLVWEDGQLAFGFVGVPGDEPKTETVAATSKKKTTKKKASKKTASKSNGDAQPTTEDTPPPLPPLPPPVAPCRAVEEKGDHEWTPAGEGVFQCTSCGQRGRMNQPPADLTQ